MDTDSFIRQYCNLPWGQDRVAFASDGSSIQFHPGSESISLVWTPANSPAQALRALMELNLDLEAKGSAILICGTDEDILEGKDWQTIWRVLLTMPEKAVKYARFDFKAKSFATHPILPINQNGTGEGGGVAMLVKRNEKLLGNYDIVALRQAFTATTHESIKSELDWALEALRA